MIDQRRTSKVDTQTWRTDTQIDRRPTDTHKQKTKKQADRQTYRQADGVRGTNIDANIGLRASSLEHTKGTRCTTRHCKTWHNEAPGGERENPEQNGFATLAISLWPRSPEHPLTNTWAATLAHGCQVSAPRHLCKVLAPSVISQGLASLCFASPPCPIYELATMIRIPANVVPEPRPAPHDRVRLKGRGTTCNTAPSSHMHHHHAPSHVGGLLKELAQMVASS